ncbi:hypothetical protein [Mucisphaera calidilacus]|uniref:Uncharacterized protein n=1 Tax=Mucisphaera calidilacus TaxID=2527982 RepID=A0A518C0M5_9BACT|nr:hypothetical protein [Mucisphaera calidilacus]QDU72769.1 hypothetical protein Pan265_26430 [Mucisphaera calidilacus]
MSKMSSNRARALLADLIRAESDWVGIAENHKLSTHELAAWASREDTLRTLGALCSLADLQTQLLLGRCRLMAASRLLTLATAEEPTNSETARKACVDLLKLDRHLPTTPDQHDDNLTPQQLREILYTHDDDEDTDHQDQP